MNEETEQDVVAGAREWLRQRDSHVAALRDELVASHAEIARLEARVGEITEVLAEFGEAEAVEPPVEPSVVRPAPRPRPVPFAAHAPPGPTATIPDLIVSALLKRPGMTAGEIVKAVLLLRASAKATTIYPTIYRMRDNARLNLDGDKYYLPVEAEEAEEVVEEDEEEEEEEQE